jgi:hypothetical protein
MSNPKPTSPPVKPKFPHATVAFYGPDDRVATKVVVAVFDKPSDTPASLNRWAFRGTDLREDPTVTREIVAWMKQHGVVHSTVSEEILGCPHEAGVDYPASEPCPLCPFWKNHPRRSPA